MNCLYHMFEDNTLKIQLHKNYFHEITAAKILC